jgi:hypothetical protein
LTVDPKTNKPVGHIMSGPEIEELLKKHGLAKKEEEGEGEVRV